jgi:two-component system phosphate regulon response regulator PhoB
VATSILIVEDEPAIREMVRFALERAGFSCREANDGERALVSIADQRPDLVLIDWMLPGMNGIDLARRLKREETTKETPVIMLTARGEEDDRIRGLEVGADDYVTKPFSPRELVARIKAVMRRYQPQNGEAPIEIEELRLDPSSHRVTINGSAVDMGPTEFRLLHFFMTHPERVYSRGQLLDRVWGSNVYVEERTVDVHIRRLRKALDAHGHDRYIQTVRGSGYRFSSKE